LDGEDIADTKTITTGIGDITRHTIILKATITAINTTNKINILEVQVVVNITGIMETNGSDN
jgi:hypothetical protein